MSVRLRALIAVCCLSALAVAGAEIATAGHAPGPYRFLATIGLFGLSQAIGLQIKFGGQRIGLFWGEAALLVGMCLLPAHWLVPVVPIGALVGLLLAGVAPIKALYNAAAYAIAAALATGVAALCGGVGDAPPLDLRTAIALVAAALTYCVVTALFAVTAVALARGGPVRELILGNCGAKIIMLVGNIAVGLLAVGLGLADFRYLAAAPPLLWLLYEVYKARMRAGDERRAWQALAAAVHALNRLDVASVVEAAIVGARRLFAPESVAITVTAPDGTARTYVGRAGMDGITETETPDGKPSGTLLHRLAVGEERVGELRVRFGTATEVSERDRLALSAFADALGAALHNAASHDRLREMAERKAYEAEHDALTGLANRTRLMDRGDAMLRVRPGEDPHEVALLLLDLDHFKDVNDTLGHDAGDQLLRTAAATLTARTEPGELLVRLGGDEFALLIGAPPARRQAVEYAVERARELTAALAVPVEIAGVALSVEASIGVAAVPAGGCVMAELLRRADVAMYQAKRGGRSIGRYEAARDAASTDRLALLAEFREALAADDQLVLYLQPAIDLASGEATGSEALIRWQHPRRGLLGPGEFVGVVEKSDLVGPFTRHVLNMALGVMARWGAEGLDIPVAVNMSARSLLDRKLPADVAELLGRHQVPPERLVLEITETVMMTELEVIDDVLAGLRSLGVRLSVDDFGTGYSSLTFLARFAVDEVKVDQEFVGRMGDTREAEAIVRSTVELGRALGLRVVAEGVETAEQKAALSAMGCEAAQGYHFFPPMPADKTAKVLWTLRSAAATRGARVIPLSARAAQPGQE
ncbi:MAG TPA: bifunctional diguanylate cyclase/phosphodiesterase [Actinocatenispora sp.]